MRLADFKRILSQPVGAGRSVATLGATAVAVPGAMPGASPAIAEGEFLYERQQEFSGIHRRLYERRVDHAERFVGRPEAVYDARCKLAQVVCLQNVGLCCGHSNNTAAQPPTPYRARQHQPSLGRPRPTRTCCPHSRHEEHREPDRARHHAE